VRFEVITKLSERLVNATGSVMLVVAAVMVVEPRWTVTPWVNSETYQRMTMFPAATPRLKVRVVPLVIWPETMVWAG